MSYQVIARKYRPQRFSDVIGQEHVTQTLGNAIKQSRIAHAYLFCGPRGTGKTTVARIFAKCLRCKNAPTIEPCNECSECKAISAGNSMDMLEFDAASNTQVEKIRDIIIDHVRYAPSSGAVKLYLIDEVHMLSNSSFNALLKTLEEPPAHVKFLFATTDPEKLP
ncbi:MAG: polymerase subunit gamma and tau, partial [Verrucomicrobiales bacterium]|nr:polymerase subunit gamma and tau [Verrucomicrobiales bacterium]